MNKLPILLLVAAGLLATEGCVRREAGPAVADAAEPAKAPPAEATAEKPRREKKQDRTPKTDDGAAIDEVWSTPLGQLFMYRRQQASKPPAETGEPAVDMTINPAFDEKFLFSGSVDRALAPEVVQKEAAGTEEAPAIFDAVGEQAKTEYVKAALLNQTGYTTKAMQHYRAAVEKDPDNIWLKNRAAHAALQQNDLPRARQYAEEVLAADPKNYTAMETMASIAIYRDRADEAKEWYAKILDVKPRHVEALENMARIAYFNDRDLEKTKEFCGRIMQITSRNMNALLWHAEASALTGDVTHAAGLYEQLVRYRPRLIDHLVDMGGRLERQERADDALLLYRRGIVMSPQDGSVRAAWEKLLGEKKGAEAVRAGYSELCDENAQDLDIQELYADYLLRTEDVEGLVAQRKRMLAIDPRHIPSLLSLARVELERKDAEAANGYFEQALAAGPEDASVWRDVALVFLEQGNVERARELLQEAAILDPRDAQTLVALARLAEQDNDIDATERILKQAIDASPGSEPLLRLLGDFYRRLDRIEEASQLYEQVLAVDAGDVQAQLVLASLYFDLANEEALDRLEIAAPKALNDPAAFWSDYGILAMQHGEWERARRALERTVEDAPANLALRDLLVKVYLHLDEPELAESTLAAGEAHLEDRDEVRLEFALMKVGLLRDLRRTQEAISLAGELVTQHPQDFSLRATLLELLVEAKSDRKLVDDQLNEVVREFTAAQPDEVKLLRASVYRQLRDYDRALKVLQPLLSESKNQRQVRFDLAITYSEMKNDAEAESHYRSIIDEFESAKEPRADWLVVNAYNNLAYHWACAGMKLDEAEKFALKALELNPHADYIHDTVGWIKFRQKDFAEAEKWLKKAEKLGLPDAEMYRNLGDLYRERNELVAARQYYERALAVDETYEGLQERLDAVNKALGAIDGAASAATEKATPGL